MAFWVLLLPLAALGVAYPLWGASAWFPVIVAAIGMGGLDICVGLWRTVQGTRACRWPTVWGRVASGGAKLGYAYEIDGASYTGDRLVFSSGLGAATKKFRQKVARLPHGCRIQIHYNPRRPKQSVLKPGASRWTLGASIARSCALAGGVVYLLGSTGRLG